MKEGNRRAFKGNNVKEFEGWSIGWNKTSQISITTIIFLQARNSRCCG